MLDQSRRNLLTTRIKSFLHHFSTPIRPSTSTFGEFELAEAAAKMPWRPLNLAAKDFDWKRYHLAGTRSGDGWAGTPVPFYCVPIESLTLKVTFEPQRSLVDISGDLLLILIMWLTSQAASLIIFLLHIPPDKVRHIPPQMLFSNWNGTENLEGVD